MYEYKTLIIVKTQSQMLEELEWRCSERINTLALYAWRLVSVVSLEIQQKD